MDYIANKLKSKGITKKHFCSFVDVSHLGYKAAVYDPARKLSLVQVYRISLLLKMDFIDLAYTFMSINRGEINQDIKKYWDDKNAK